MNPITVLAFLLLAYMIIHEILNIFKNKYIKTLNETIKKQNELLNSQNNLIKLLNELLKSNIQ